MHSSTELLYHKLKFSAYRFLSDLEISRPRWIFFAFSETFFLCMCKCVCVHTRSASFWKLSFLLYLWTLLKFCNVWRKVLLQIFPVMFVGFLQDYKKRYLSFTIDNLKFFLWTTNGFLCHILRWLEILHSIIS